MIAKLGLIFWYIIASHLPRSSFPFYGKIGKRIRRWTVKLIFKDVGENVNIDKGVYFGTGKEIIIGDYSGIGRNCRVPSNTVIGNYVMMAEDVLIYNYNHRFDDLTIPMCKQGRADIGQLTIKDDVWIGARVIILPSVNFIGTGDRKSVV